MMRIGRVLFGVLGLTLGALAMASPASAHCDSMDGPVVKSADAALTTGEVERVMMWVSAQDEAEIREAFDRTLEVRQQSEAARALADRWFFETLVRIHREGEGAPYTGLKPAGYEPPAGITLADRALEHGSADELVTRVSAHLEDALRESFAGAEALRDHAPGDVEAGRRYVEAYVRYTHLVEAIVELLHGGGHGH